MGLCLPGIWPSFTAVKARLTHSAWLRPDVSLHSEYMPKAYFMLFIHFSYITVRSLTNCIQWPRTVSMHRYLIYNMHGFPQIPSKLCKIYSLKCLYKRTLFGGLKSCLRFFSRYPRYMSRYNFQTLILKFKSLKECTQQVISPDVSTNIVACICLVH